MELILLDAFSVTRYITHPISLLAYIVAAVLFYFVNRDINRRKLIESTPEADRANVIIQTAEKLHMDIADVPRNERAALIRQVLQNRIYTQVIIAVVIVVLGMIGSYVYIRNMDITHKPFVVVPIKPSKIAINDFTAKVTFTIGNVEENAPEIFKNTSQLEIRIADNSKIVNKDVVGWDNRFFLADTLFKLISTKQEFDKEFKPTTEDSSLDLIRDYSRFTGNFSAALHENYDWTKASSEGLIRVSEFNKWVDSLIDENSDFYISRENFFAEYEATSRQIEDWTDNDKRLFVYPIRAYLNLYYKGNIIGRSHGIVVRVIEHQNGDMRRLFVVKFPVTKLITST